jgi:hypothetical protein
MRGKTAIKISAGLAATALLVTACGGGGYEEAASSSAVVSVEVAEPQYLLPSNTNETSGVELIFIDFAANTGKTFRAPAGQGAWLLNQVSGDRLIVGTYYDGKLMVFDLKTMATTRAESVSERRFVLTLASVFGVLALLLATSGVYGVMALIVSERTPEVGVRVALGATRTDILGLIVGQSARLGLTGIVLGTGGSLVLAPLMANQLFGVRPFDIVTFAIVPIVLMAAAIAAAVMPARRAMQVDPVVALRND